MDVGQILGRRDAGNSTRSTEILVESGKGMTVNVGGKGTTIVGRIALPDDSNVQVKLDATRGKITCLPDSPPYPPGIKMPKSQKEWYEKWATGPMGREYLQRSLRQNFSVNAEGVFVVHDIPPGDYELQVATTENKPSKNGIFVYYKFTVDEDESNTHVSLGELKAIIIGP